MEARMIKKFGFFSLLLTFVLTAAFTAFAQETVGSIEITTKDPQGAVVPGVPVTITSEGAAGFRRTVTTDSQGFARILQVAPGTYSVASGAHSGFAAKTLQTRVELGKATQVTIDLAAQGAGATVDVTSGDTAVVDTTSSEISNSVSAARIDALPKGVNFTSILKVVPGVRAEPLAGGFSIDGATNSENTFVIDGQEVTNYRNAGLNSNNNVPFPLVQEVQVKNSGFNAEYGGATGGVINVVTKGGNNTWRGDFGMQFEPSGLRADNRPGLNRFTTGSIATTTYQQFPEYITSPKSQDLNFLPSANLSGPIVKNKLWFFGSYSPTIFTQTTETKFYSSAPVATRTFFGSQTYTAKQKNEYAFGRLDANPTSKLRVTGTYLWNPLKQQGINPYGTISLSGNVPATPASNCATFPGLGQYCGNDLSSRQGGIQTSNNVTASAVYTFTSNIVGSFRYSRGFLNEKLGNYFKFSGVRYICQNGSTAARAFAGACNQGEADPANEQTVKDISVRENYEGDGTFLFNGGGRHELKGGYAHMTIFNDLLKAFTTRVYMQYGAPIDADFNWSHPALPSAPICAVGQTTGCVLGHGTLYRFGQKGSGENLNQAFYVQDKWQPTRRLTLNLGVRIEKEDIPSYNGFAAPFAFGWGDKVAPRLGFAYDLTGDGKTKVFGSYGNFFDRLKFRMAQGSFGGDFYRTDFFELSPDGRNYRAYTPEVILGNFTDPIGGKCAPTGFIGSGLSRCQVDWRVASNVPGADIEEAGGVDVNLKPYQQRELTFGAERELWKNFVLRGRFTNKKLINAIEDAGAISSQGSEIYITGNPGEGYHADFLKQFGYNAPYAHPRRDYNAVEIVLDRRLANNYFFNMSYTYSRLRGNYSGLSNSDEGGRSDPGVNRSFDLPLIGFTAKGKDDYGPLATDRPHVFSAYGGYSKKWGHTANTTDFSFFQTFQSGTPRSTLISFIVPIFLNERGDLGRTPMFTNTDFNVQHNYRFGTDKRYGVEVSMNILNLWDEANVLGYQDTITNKALASFQNAYGYGCGTATNYPCLINKFNSGALYSQLNANLTTNATLDTSGVPVNRNIQRADFKMPNSYQGPRTVRFGMKFTF